MSELDAVEVVITAYAEPPEALARTVDAVLRQTHPPQRVWVVDDGSPTPIRLPASLPPEKVRLIRMDPNGGIAAARNAAIARCTSPFVAVVNVDILLDEDWIESCRDYLIENKGVGVCCTPVRPAHPGRLLTRWRMRFQEERYHEDYTEGSIRFAAGHATLFRADALREVGGYDERYRRVAEDYDVCRRLRERGWETHCTQASGATSLQEDSLDLLATKYLRNDGWTLRSPSDLDAVLRPVSLPGVTRDISRGLIQHLLRNVVRGRLSFLPVDIAVSGKAWLKALNARRERALRYERQARVGDSVDGGTGARRRADRAFHKRISRRVRFEVASALQEVVQVEGVRVRLRRDTSRAVRREIFAGNYELAERRLLDRLLKVDDVVMELGTGLGLLSAAAAARVGSTNVYTYEANPQMEDAIRDTFTLNGVQPSVTFCMIGRKEGESAFFVTGDFWSSSSLPPTGDARVVRVPMRSFDSELIRIRPTVLAIDIEGGELDLLRGADLLGVRALVMEVHVGVIGADGADEVRRSVEEAGLQVTEVLSVPPHEVWAAVRTRSHE